MSCNVCRDGRTALGRPCPNGCPATTGRHEAALTRARAELRRQAEASTSGLYVDADDARDAVIDGPVDLEALVRAVLDEGSQ